MLQVVPFVLRLLNRSPKDRPSLEDLGNEKKRAARERRALVGRDLEEPLCKGRDALRVEVGLHGLEKDGQEEGSLEGKGREVRQSLSILIAIF